MRSMGGGGFSLPGMESTAAKLAAGLVAGSVLYALTKETVGLFLLLSPTEVFRKLWLWQPFTYAFVENSAMGVIFGALILFSIGGGLEMSWGSRRVAMVAVGGAVLAGLLTSVVGLVLPLPVGYSGGYVMSSILWVSYGLYLGRGQTNFWGMPVTGNVFAGIGAGFVVLNSLFSSWLHHLPELFGLCISFAYVRGGSPRALWLRLQHWRLQRQLRGRSRHLRVISEERPDDRYLN
jgi:membrane associated rhomboid family serine protease